MSNTDLDHIVWQYLQKETPSLATEFRKIKNIKAKGGSKVTLDSVYEIYIKNKPGATKRQNKNEINKSTVNKKPCLRQDEEENEISEANEKEVHTSVVKDENNKENDKSVNDEKQCLTKEQENGSKDIKSADNKKPLLNENNLSSKDSSGVKPSAKDNSESNNMKKRKALLPKPKRKKTLLAPPFTSVHHNDPNFYRKDDIKKPLLPEPSPLIPTMVPSGRKTLLIEPLYSAGRNEKKPLLSSIPTPPYSEDERTRRILLTEPLPLFAQDERTRKPLLMEPVPPPPLMRESTSRIDRMGLLAESLPLTRLYPESSERMSLLSHPSVSDKLDALYRKERKSLLDEPPTSMVLQDYLRRKEKESLLIDPSSGHYYDSRDRKAGLLSGMPLPLGIEDNTNRKKRVLLPDRSPPLPRREYAADPLDSANSSDRMYNRKEPSSLPKPLIFADKQQYDDSSQLYSRRVRAKESASDNSQWKDKGILLAELENYLKKHLSCSSEKNSNTSERNSLLSKPVDIQDYKEVDKSSRISNPPRLSPDSYAYYMREKAALVSRKDYYQVVPGFAENTRAEKSGADLAVRKEKESRNVEALMSIGMRNYEEELKSIGIDYNSEIGNAFRRASEKELRSLDQEVQRRSYERFGGKMGFL